MTTHSHPDGQVLSCKCGARLFDPWPSVRTQSRQFIPSLWNGSDAIGAQRLAWKRAHQHCQPGAAA